jgi:hypothetical protein
MMTRVVLRDAELASLSEDERLALEYAVRSALSETARERRAGDSALLLAVSAAEVLGLLLERIGEDATDALIDEMLASDIGRTALRRASAVASLTAAA